MNFPEVLKVSVIEKDSGTPIANVAIVMKLFAARKNDYGVGPLITNADGEVSFTRRDCEKAIKVAQEMFLMDFVGDLSSCQPMIDVHLHLPEHISRMLANYKTSPRFWGMSFENPDSFFLAMSMVRNTDYQNARIMATEEQLLSNPHLTLSLQSNRRQPHL